MAQNTIWVLISQEIPTTYAIGLYATQEEAQTDFVDLLLKQVNFTKLSELFDEKSEDFDEVTYELPLKNLDRDQLKSVIFEGTNDENDFFAEYLPCTIIEHNIGEIFDLRKWTDWNYENLYILLIKALTGDIGRLTGFWPYARARLMLGAL